MAGLARAANAELDPGRWRYDDDQIVLEREYGDPKPDLLDDGCATDLLGHFVVLDDSHSESGCRT